MENLLYLIDEVEQKKKWKEKVDVGMNNQNSEYQNLWNVLPIYHADVQLLNLVFHWHLGQDY